MAANTIDILSDIQSRMMRLQTRARKVAASTASIAQMRAECLTAFRELYRGMALMVGELETGNVAAVRESMPELATSVNAVAAVVQEQLR